MRHIAIAGMQPDLTWVTNANGLLAKLKAAPDAAARNKIIDDNDTVWGELKQWLLNLSHQKCWFSEAKDCFSHMQVEHFRPKKSAKDLDGTTHEGYWWLAFDWQNFRICTNALNPKKGTCFPLRKKCIRCSPHGDLRYEITLLLDPVDEDDPALLSFNVLGEAIPAAHVTDAWERSRVEYSVTRYNLTFSPLADRRKAVWSECWNRIQDYLRELILYQNNPTNVIAKHALRHAAGRIREMMKPDKELSSVARACVISSGDPRVTAILQTN
jgi:hypothetical protein